MALASCGDLFFPNSIFSAIRFSRRASKVTASNKIAPHRFVLRPTFVVDIQVRRHLSPAFHMASVKSCQDEGKPTDSSRPGDNSPMQLLLFSQASCSALSISNEVRRS
jgi:hypothetical protein